MTSETTIDIPQQHLHQSTTARGDARTLAPLAHTSVGGPRRDAAGVRARPRHRHPHGRERRAMPLDFTLAEPVFDDAWTGILAQSLPFRAGYTVTAEVYDKDRGVQAVTYTVDGPGYDGAGAEGARAVLDRPRRDALGPVHVRRRRSRRGTSSV